MRTSFKQVFTHLVNSTTVYAAITDFQGNIVEYNRLFANAFAETPAVLNGASFANLFASEDTTLVQKTIRKCMSDISLNTSVYLHHPTTAEDGFAFDCTVLRDEDQIPQA